jgi:peptidyl-prolyl cis-trans isomerase D
VRQRLIERTAAERGRAMAEAIAKKINDGMAPAQAYAQAGIPLPPPETRTERRSEIERAGQQAPPPFRILFAIPEGRARIVAAPNNAGWIIVHHQRRTPGSAGDDAEGRAALSEAQRRLGSSGASELVTQFARAVRSVVTVERDEERINTLRRELIAGQ